MLFRYERYRLGMKLKLKYTRNTLFRFGNYYLRDGKLFVKGSNCKKYSRIKIQWLNFNYTEREKHFTINKRYFKMSIHVLKATSKLAYYN